MKDLVQIWNKVTNRRYSADKEMKDLTNNRLKRIEIEKSNIECDFSECEGLNNFEDIDFNEKKDAIINRLFERRKQGQVARQPKCLFILLMLGFIALSIGCFILFVKPYNFLFNQKVLLQDGGEIFEMWRKPEVQLYTRVFLFNVTNSEEYLAGKDEKIKLQEVGPYVYREALEHKVQSFNSNGTLSAIPLHPLTWVEEMSEGHREDDIVYMPHIALLSIANVVSQQNLFARFGLNNLITLTNSQPLTKMTAKEFMMGYKSELMTLGNTFLPRWIYFDKLGLIDRMYDFDGDFETVYTGETDIRLSGLIDTYRGSTDLPQWEGKHCSNVQYASDGTKFRGGVTKNETLLFYRKSLCRAAPLIPSEEGVRSGIRGVKYVFPEHMLDNGKYNEENKCFCRNGKCLPEGLIDVADCYYGFPIALSYPHFYKGDDVLFSKVEGLTPKQEEHETSFWIQPESGLPLEVSSKFQINMALGSISSITNTERFSNMYLPMLWFDIRMYALPPSLEQRFKLYLNILPIVEQAAMYIMFITGAVLVITTIYILSFNVMFKNFEKNKDAWLEKAKLNDGVYAPCEIPLSESDSDEMIKLNIKLNDRLYETVNSVKDKLTEMAHVKSLFDRKPSLKDSSQTSKAYEIINQTDSDEDFKYLEVIEDGELEGCDVSLGGSQRMRNLKDLDERNNELSLHISD